MKAGNIIKVLVVLFFSSVNFCFSQNIPVFHNTLTFLGNRICKGDSVFKQIGYYVNCNSCREPINLVDQKLIYSHPPNSYECKCHVEPGNRAIPKVEGSGAEVSQIVYNVLGDDFDCNFSYQHIYGNVIIKIKPAVTSHYKVSWQTHNTIVDADISICNRRGYSEWIEDYSGEFDIVVSDPKPPTLFPKDTTVLLNSSFPFRVNADFETNDQKALVLFSDTANSKGVTIGLDPNILHYVLQPLASFKADSIGVFTVRAKDIDGVCPSDFSDPVTVKVQCSSTPPQLLPKDTTVSINSSLRLRVNADFKTYDQKLVVVSTNNTTTKTDTISLNSSLHYIMAPLIYFTADAAGAYTVKAKLIDGECESTFSSPVTVHVVAECSGSRNTACPSHDIVGELIWDKSFPTQNNKPIGVAADGVGRLYLKISKADANSTPAIESVVINLSDENHYNSSMLGKVMSVSNNAINAYDLEANNATSISDFSSSSQNGNFWFWFVAPDDFSDNANSNLQYASERIVNAHATATFTDGKEKSYDLEIKVVRPPLLLVHGIASDENCWNEFYYTQNSDTKSQNSDTKFINSSLFKYKNALKLGRYNSFYSNARQLLGDGNFYQSFQGNISKLRDQGYSCNQVDYVCHSMGDCHNNTRKRIQKQHTL